MASGEDITLLFDTGRQNGYGKEVSPDGELDLSFIIHNVSLLDAFIAYRSPKAGAYLTQKNALIINEAAKLRDGYLILAKMGISVMGDHDEEVDKVCRSLNDYVLDGPLLPMIELSSAQDASGAGHPDYESACMDLMDIGYMAANGTFNEVYSAFAHLIGLNALGFSQFLKRNDANMLYSADAFIKEREKAYDERALFLCEYARANDQTAGHLSEIERLRPLPYSPRE
ncbi:MAG: hypothetical protein NDI94_02745 [Candidatus Woesearchaeota archaeon]|nr:hypothetical protein [Candidatus Woesearchaeota archaeon]